MRPIRHICILTCLLATAGAAAGQTFLTEKLEKAVKVLDVTLSDNVLRPGQTSHLTVRDGQPIVVRTNQQGVIEHVGIALFNEKMRLLMPSPVYDFLEYAVMNWKYKVNPNQLYLSKVIFQRGDWHTLINNHLSNYECDISNHDDRLYIVNWSNGADVVATVGIPIEYELLGNDTRRNMERDLVRHLAASESPAIKPQTPSVSESDLKIYGTQGLFVLPGNWYILNELNQNVYYELKTMYETVDTIVRGRHERMTLEDVVPTIVANEEFPAESLANLMIADDGLVADAIMHLDFHLSDYHRQKLTMPMSHLRRFFHSQGCTTYYACSGISKDQVSGMILVNNIAKGYNHLISLKLPISNIGSKQPEIEAAAYLYIPPIDKSHLFAKTPTKKSGAKIY